MGGDAGADGVGEDLFGGGSETEIPLVAVLDPPELGAVGVPAAGLLPELGGLHGGGQDLLSAGAVHLLSDDVLDLLEDPPAQRHEVVDASDFLSYHVCP